MLAMAKTKTHKQPVDRLASQIRTFYAQKQPFRVYHGTTNSTRTMSFDRRSMVDTSKLTHVLSVDTNAKTVVVESNVPMDKLVRATLKHGLVPAVVPEFPGITVGGAIQGGAGESSSFKWGGVNNIANWYEIILADGTLQRVSPSEHADLFWGAAGSYGSLGVITAAELQLIPAKPYVSVTYLPAASFADAVRLARQATKDGYDFVDGIIFAKDRAVIIAGRMADKPVGRLRRFRGPHDEWFYLHADKRAKSGQPATESIPIIDYLFRYDRGAFWMGKYAFDMFGIGFNRTNRLLLNGLLNTRRMYQALQASNAAQDFIIQDVAMPADNTTAFLEYVNASLGIYPLWLCPLAVDDSSPLHASYLNTDEVINVGVWGPFIGNHQACIAANKAFEETVHKLGGRKWLYARTYYSPQAFWSIYNQSWYEGLRRKYHAETLPNVYDKVHADDKRLPVNKKRGLWKAISSRKSVSVSAR